MEINNKILTIFVEGDTEEAFVGLVKAEIRRKYGITKFPFKQIKTYNLRGSGNIKRDIVARIKQLQKIKALKGCEFIVVIFRDTDVFEYAPKPPFKISDVKKALKGLGVKRIHEVKAVRCIEDWYLKDTEALCRCLKIPVTTPSGKNGVEKIKSLFKKAKRTYVKGNYTLKFLTRMDMGRVLESLEEELKAFIDVLRHG